MSRQPGLTPRRGAISGGYEEDPVEGKTVVLTTHYMDEAEELCDRVAIMDRGKIIAMESPHVRFSDCSLTDSSKRVQALASLEDVFLKLTGHSLREE